MNTTPGDTNTQNVPLPSGYERCIELTKGFERAAPEPIDRTIYKLIRNLAIFIPFLLVGLIWLSFNPSGSPAMELYAFVIVIFAVSVIGINYFNFSIQARAKILCDLNSIYYKIDSLIDPFRVDGEKVLLLLALGRPVSLISRSLENPYPPTGLLVLTTHRLFVFTSKARISSWPDHIMRSSLLDIGVCDYSYAPDFLEGEVSKDMHGRWVAKKFWIKTHLSPEPSSWEVMPIDSNNYNLLEAILAKRDRIEK